jgi:ABC-type transporter MlaC component
MVMAKWDASANKSFSEIKNAAHKNDADMQTLKQQIDRWADRNPDGTTSFPFGQYRHSRVEVQTKGGWITKVDYGEN